MEHDYTVIKQNICYSLMSLLESLFNFSCNFYMGLNPLNSTIEKEHILYTCLIFFSLYCILLNFIALTKLKNFILTGDTQ